MVVEPDQSRQLRYGDGSAIRAEFPRELPLEPLDLRRLEPIHTPENMEPSRRRRQHVRRFRQIASLGDPPEYGRAVAVRIEEYVPNRTDRIACPRASSRLDFIDAAVNIKAPGVHLV
jgi:hypothetical protein